MGCSHEAANVGEKGEEVLSKIVKPWDSLCTPTDDSMKAGGETAVDAVI